MDLAQESSVVDSSQKETLNQPLVDSKRTVSPTISPPLCPSHEVIPVNNQSDTTTTTTMDQPGSWKIMNANTIIKDNKSNDIIMDQQTTHMDIFQRYHPAPTQVVMKQDPSKNITMANKESAVPLWETKKSVEYGVMSNRTQPASLSKGPSAGQARRPSGLEFIAMAASFVERQSSSGSLQQSVTEESKPSAPYPPPKNIEKKGRKSNTSRVPVVNGVLRHRKPPNANRVVLSDTKSTATSSASLVSTLSAAKASPSSAGATTDTASKASNRKGKKKVRKWTRPADKPKRPLSAYNIFFRTERERMIKEKGRVAKSGNTASPSSRGIGFGGMAKAVADKWNTLSETERGPFEKQAGAEKSKYFIALEQWKRDQLLKKQQQNGKLVATDHCKPPNGNSSPPSSTEPLKTPMTTGKIDFKSS